MLKVRRSNYLFQQPYMRITLGHVHRSYQPTELHDRHHYTSGHLKSRPASRTRYRVSSRYLAAYAAASGEMTFSPFLTFFIIHITGLKEHGIRRYHFIAAR